MKKTLLLLSILSLFLSTTWGDTKNIPDKYNFSLALEKLSLNANPILAARINFKAHKNFYLGVYGFAFEAPGASGACNKYKTTPIPETSDVITSDAHLKYNQQSTKYAEAYNIETDKLCLKSK